MRGVGGSSPLPFFFLKKRGKEREREKGTFPKRT